MASTSIDVVRKLRNIEGMSYGHFAVATSAAIPKGALVVSVNSSGRVTNATAATGRKFVGVAEEAKTGNTAGTVLIRVAWGMECLLPISTQATKAYVGSNVAIRDNNTVTTMSNAGTAAVRVRVGEFVQIESAGLGWVRLREYVESDV